MIGGVLCYPNENVTPTSKTAKLKRGFAVLKAGAGGEDRTLMGVIELIIDRTHFLMR